MLVVGQERESEQDRGYGSDQDIGQVVGSMKARDTRQGLGDALASYARRGSGQTDAPRLARHRLCHSYGASASSDPIRWRGDTHYLKGEVPP